MVYDMSNEDEFGMKVVDSGMILACILALLIASGAIYGLYELACYLMEVL